MLLPIRPETPVSNVFSTLNDELINFFTSTATSTKFSKKLFSTKCRDAIWGNKPTRAAFRHLWNELNKMPPTDRSLLASSLSGSQVISDYFSDPAKLPPTTPSTVHSKLYSLVFHLFSHTSGLAKIKQISSESVSKHYREFCKINKRICCACGMEKITQWRAHADVCDEKQWRGPYDHFLPKEKYPAFGVHPRNLIPICNTCNSKAKLSADPLVNSTNGQRRISFNPLTESADNYVSVKIDPISTTPVAHVVLGPADADTHAKIQTWDDIYKIKQRVDGALSDVIELIDEDCQVDDIKDFKKTIARKAISFSTHCRRSEMNFWKHKLYNWLSNEPADVIEAIWTCIEFRRDEPNYQSEYGIR